MHTNPLQKVMLVDDDPVIRRIGAVALSRVGNLEVVLAGSGAEALALAESERPQLILLDVMMEGLDGPETFAALRGQPASRDIPVIFVTGKVFEEETRRYEAMGAIGVIAKPFDPMRLAADVERIFASSAPIVGGDRLP